VGGLLLHAVADAAQADVGLREHLPIGFGRAEFPEAERSRLFHDSWPC